MPKATSFAMALIRLLTAAMLVGMASAAGSDFKDLDESNWGKATEGKNVFVMFQAPW